MTVGSELDERTQAWLARAAAAAESLRSLRRRLLDLHAELSGLRTAVGTAATDQRSSEPIASRDAGPAPALGGEPVPQDAAETAPFVWPAGRAPN